MKLFEDERLKVGTKFKCNVNGALFEIIKMENPVTCYKVDWKVDTESARTNNTKNAIIKDCKTGRVFQYGLEALKRCNITILE